MKKYISFFLSIGLLITLPVVTKGPFQYFKRPCTSWGYNSFSNVFQGNKTLQGHSIFNHTMYSSSLLVGTSLMGIAAYLKGQNVDEPHNTIEIKKQKTVTENTDLMASPTISVPCLQVNKPSGPFRQFIQKEKAKKSVSRKGYKYRTQEKINKKIFVTSKALSSCDDDVKIPNNSKYDVTKKLKVINGKKTKTVAELECEVTDIQNSCKARIYWVETDKKHRGKGYATFLLNSIEKNMKEAGCESLELEAVPKAVSLYARNGYKIVGKDDNLTLMRHELY